MSEIDVQILARHLGHDVSTHRQFYRLSHSTVQLSKVSKLRAFVHVQLQKKDIRLFLLRFFR